MYRIITTVSLLLLSTGIAFADKPKPKPTKSVAAVTTYVPAVGDTLHVEFLNQESKWVRQEITIAHIASNQSVKLNVKAFEIIANGKDHLIGEVAATWTPRKNFLAELPANDYKVSWKNFVLGKKSISCCVLTLGKAEFWIAADRGSKVSVPPGPTTTMPGMVLYKEDGEVRYKLKKIIQSKSKSKSSGK